MDKALRDAEFAMAVVELRSSMSDLQNEMTHGSGEPILFRKLQNYLSMSISRVEAFHPVAEDDIGYLKNLPLLGEARSTLKKADLMTPPLRNEKPDKPVEPIEHVQKQDWRMFQIPKLNLESFNGDILKYSSFLSTFKAMYDSLPISDLQKLIYLRNHLTGPALEKVQFLQPLDESYKVARDILDKCYNKKGKLLVKLYDQLATLMPAEKNPTSLRKTFDKIEDLLTTLEANDQNVNESHHVRAQVLSKFPRSLLKKLCEDDDATLPDIRKMVANYINMIEEVETCAEQADILTGRKTRKDVPRATMGTLVAAQRRNPRAKQGNNQEIAIESKTTQQTKPTMPCVFCGGEHFNDQCTKYTTVADRKAQISGNCFNCLRQGHTIKTCRYSKPCWHCRQVRNHHSALCPNKRESTATTVVKTVEQTTSEKVSTAKENRSTLFARKARGTYLTATMKVANPQNGTETKLRLVLDSGSNQTYITQRAVVCLGLITTENREVDVEVFGGTILKNVPTAATKFQIYVNSTESVTVEAETIPEITNSLQACDMNEFRKWYPEYAELTFADDDPQLNIEILIGNDYLWDLLRPTNIVKIHANVQLVDTRIGYFVVGKPLKGDRVLNPNFLTLQQATEEFWKLDRIGVKDNDLDRDNEQEMALNKFYDTIRFDEHSKRYLVKFPFRMEPPLIESNFMLALGRLKSVYKKFVQNPVVFRTYEETLAQQLRNGIIEEVEIKSSDVLVHYLPHHPVMAPEKSTKIRIVYDASAKTRKDALSLNETMHKGRNLLEGMVAILLRFRTHRVAIVSDIERAFHQIAIHEDHRDYTRFLWMTDTTQEPSRTNVRAFRFMVVPFGIVSSPFLLAATIRHHLKEQRTEISDRLNENIYVDNVITGEEDETKANLFCKRAVELFEKCSMNLRLWNSNSEKFMRCVPHELRDNAETVSVLGLRWHTGADTLSVFGIPQVNRGTRCTPKIVLKFASRFFDPLGLWLPLTLRPKLLLQRIRERSSRWDSELNEEEETIWYGIQEDMQKASSHTFPRRNIDTNGSQGLQLHAFTDASANAYAAAVYLRSEKAGETKSTLIFAKGRIAPRGKRLTIPKLELMAAYIGAQAVAFVRTSLNMENVETHMWIDSRCVLAWLHTTKILPLFIENRVREIKNVKGVTYRYVESALNVADMPSRTATYEEIIRSRWYAGPIFLQQNESTWRVAYAAEESEMIANEVTSTPNLRNVLIAGDTEERQQGLLNRYSSLRKLLRVTKHGLRFLAAFQVIRRRGLWQSSDWSLAEILRIWICIEQKRCYGDIIEDLKHKRKNELVNLWRATVDEKGFIRVVGRMRYAPVDDEAKHLVLLPTAASSNLTRLLILNEHRQIHHAGTSATLAAIRRLFWVPQGRRTVYNVLRGCAKCRRYTARPYKQPALAAYPDFKVRQGTCFEYAGVDQLGPLMVRNKKWYMLLYTCLVTRAVMLEVLEDLTNDQLVLAFRRIIARRGAPSYVMSDRATQFVSIRALEHVVDTHIEWSFIPPHASWAGGAYERLIAIVKQALFRSFHNTALTESQLRTIAVEVEMSVNSRPITYVYESGDEPQPLTPNDFLGIKLPSYTDPREPVRFETATRKQLVLNWKKSVRILDGFWQRWAEDYLMYLRERQERYRFRRNTSRYEPKTGHVVLIREPLTKRNRWPMGVVEVLHFSHDQEVRSATVRVSNGGDIARLHRPVQDLYPLELTDENEDEPATERENNQSTQSTEISQVRTNTPDMGSRRQSDEFSIAEIEVEEHEIIEIESDMFDF